MKPRILGLVLFASSLVAQGTYTISTLAGSNSTVQGYAGDGGPATQARLNQPQGLALDKSGNLYIADTWNQVIRLVDLSGRIRTVAGTGAQGYGGDGGPATQAKLLFPRGIALDSHGNVYLADTQNNRIRRISPDGIIATFAGTGERGYEGDGGPAIRAKLSWPWGIVIDSLDVLYFTEFQNGTVRKITPDGIISKLAGLPGARINDPLSPFAWPRGIALDRAGFVYVADGSHNRVSRIDPNGTVTVVAGDSVNRGISGTEAPGDGGPALAASIPNPMAVAIDPGGNLLIAAGKIRKVDRDGVIATVLGARLDGPVAEDGNRLNTRLGSPADLVVDGKGNLYVADTFRHRVLRMSPSGSLTVIAGLSVLPEEIEGGPAELVHLSNPSSVAAVPGGGVLIADTGLNRILRIAPDGRFSKVAGKGIPIIRIEGIGPPPQFSGDGGPATAADLDYPTGVAIDSHGNIFISDSLNNRIRKVFADGHIETIAGNGKSGYGGDGGSAVAAKLAHPMGLAVDAQGNVYVADRENNRIRQITPEGTIRTVIGNGRQGRSGDGPARSIRLDSPHGVAIDGNGILYVADTFNHRIRRLDLDGIVRTVAGTGKQEFSGDDGPALKAGLGAPDSLAIDSEGNIYIADRANWRVRKITRDGLIHTIAGNHETGFYGDGGPALKAPIFPTSVAVDARGVVYITDHNRIRVLTQNENK